MTLSKSWHISLRAPRAIWKKTNRAHVERIVSNYIKGDYKSNTRAYGSDFSKKHTTVDLYEMVTGEKLEGGN